MIPLNWAVSVLCPTLPENNRLGRQAKFWMRTWFIKDEYALGHEKGDVVNSYADLKKSGVRIMRIFGCEKNSSANENRERPFFFVTIACPIKSRSNFMC